MRNTTDGPNSTMAVVLKLLAVTLLTALVAVLSPAITEAQDAEPEEPVVEEPVVEPSEEPVVEEPVVEPSEEPVIEEPVVEPADTPNAEAGENAPPEDQWEGYDVTDPWLDERPLLPESAAADCSVVFSARRNNPIYRVAPSVGTHRAAILFVDFADARATESTGAVLDRMWSETDDFVESLSSGNLEFRTYPRQEWINLAGQEADYMIERWLRRDPSPEVREGVIAFFRETLNAAGTAGDPRRFSSVTIMLEKTAAFNGGLATNWGTDTAGRDPVVVAGVGAFAPPTNEVDLEEAFIAHELFHTMGLPDLYNFEAAINGSSILRHQHVGNFSPMGQYVGYAGGTFFGPHSTKNGNELFALEAWDLGWLNDSQIVCADGLSTTARLSGASQGGAKAIMVPVSSTVSLFAEVREQARWDEDIEAEGVLVYTHDENIVSGDGPIQVLGEFDGWWADGSVLLQPGESLMYRDRWQVLVGTTSNGRYNVTVNDFGMCNGLPVTINMNTPGVTGIGTEGDDVIMGTPGRDIITSLGGNDTVCSLDGVDWIDLGAGDDTAFAGLGTDAVWGRTGRDTIHGEGGSDYIWGGTAKDTIWAGSGADRVFGEDGPDTLNGMGGQDFMWGGEGDDVMQGNWQSDQMWGGPGNDTMRGAQGKDMLYGEDGNDDLAGGDNSDWLDGGPGIDTANGQTGRENPVIAGVQGCVAETVSLC